MKEDLQYKIIQDLEYILKGKQEAAISYIPIPLVKNNDWNPYLFEELNINKEYFLELPDVMKIGCIERNYCLKNGINLFEYRDKSYAYYKENKELVEKDKVLIDDPEDNARRIKLIESTKIYYDNDKEKFKILHPTFEE